MQKKIRLTSPHSLLAIRLIGVTLDDLKYISLDDYIKKNPDIQNLEIELQEERYNHHEQNRLELINEAKKLREDLLKDNNYETSPYNNISSLYISPKSNINNYSYNFSTTMKKNVSATNLNPKMNLPQTSTAVILEREKLQKLLKNQENKVKLQIDYECMIEENRRKNLEKMHNKELKEEKRRTDR